MTKQLHPSIPEYFVFADFPYLKYSEFVVSGKHSELLLDIQLDDIDMYKIRIFTATIFIPLRGHFKKRIDITSGKCSRQLNAAIGRDPFTTDHSWFNDKFAADLIIGLDSDLTYTGYQWIRKNLPHSFGQLIWEQKQGIIHISLPTESHRGEAFELKV